MNKVKINSFQLFVLVFLYEMGSAILIGLAGQALQDAWMAILLGMAGGVMIFLIYHRLFTYYPELMFTSYVQEITGKWLGRIIGFLYIIYYIYFAARVLRDFGDLLTSTIYTRTPELVITALMVLTILYAIYKGIEVLARVGELIFFLVYIMAISGALLIVFSGLIQLDNLKPMLENGIMPVLRVTISQTILIPYGEMVVFTMLFPLLNEPKKAKKICLFGMIISGLNLTITAVISLTTLGVDLFIRSPFPLLSVIQKIQLFNFIERLDVLFMLYLTVGAFMKIAILYYVAVAGIADLFKLKEPGKMMFPIGLVVLFASSAVGSNYSEVVKEGLDVIPVYLHWPMQIIIPGMLLIIAFFRNLGKKSQVAKDG